GLSQHSCRDRLFDGGQPSPIEVLGKRRHTSTIERRTHLRRLWQSAHAVQWREPSDYPTQSWSGREDGASRLRVGGRLAAMKHLFRQWRLVRYVARRIEKERDDSQSGKWGETYRLQAATVRDDYAKEKHFSSDEAQDLLSACVQDGLIGERLENETTWVWIV